MAAEKDRQRVELSAGLLESCIEDRAKDEHLSLGYLVHGVSASRLHHLHHHHNLDD
tara:strand:+ start:1153 stop:1320 length:168 start_codon:yes stop_codon:yes gene_type:complete